MKITKRTVAAGTIGAVAASGLGLVLLGAPSALAATTDSSDTSSSTSTDASAGSRLQAIKDALAGLVSGGTLTQAQADEVATTLDSSDALRGGGRGGHGGGPGGRLVSLDTAATTIGISTDDLRTALQADGATLASVAADHDVTEQTLVDALVAAAKTHLAEEVTEGDLTQAQADERIAALPETVTAAVEREFTGGRGGRGDGDDSDDTSGSTSGAAPSGTAYSSGSSVTTV